MTRTYRWTTFGDKLPHGAIIVGVAGASIEMMALGLSYVEPIACIYWPAWFGSEGQISRPGSEMGPWSVPEALERAEELRREFGYLRVVVTLERRSLWRDEWGGLAEREAYD